MRLNEPGGSWNCDTESSTAFKCAGTFIYIGMPPLSVRDLVSDPSLWQIALVPHISGRGPNGAWLIRRGPEHPDVRAIAHTHAFHLGQPGEPDLICHVGRFKNVEVLELFRTAELAASEAAHWADEGFDEAQVIRATGNELLRLFRLVDAVEIDGLSFPLTYAGAAHFESDRVPLSDIIATLSLSTGGTLIGSEGSSIGC